MNTDKHLKDGLSVTCFTTTICRQFNTITYVSKPSLLIAAADSYPQNHWTAANDFVSTQSARSACLLGPKLSVFFCNNENMNTFQ